VYQNYGTRAEFISDNDKPHALVAALPATEAPKLLDLRVVHQFDCGVRSTRSNVPAFMEKS
jgi:hypothetical protein